LQHFNTVTQQFHIFLHLLSDSFDLAIRQVRVLQRLKYWFLLEHEGISPYAIDSSCVIACISAVPITLLNGGWWNHMMFHLLFLLHLGRVLGHFIFSGRIVLLRLCLLLLLTLRGVILGFLINRGCCSYLDLRCWLIATCLAVRPEGWWIRTWRLLLLLFHREMFVIYQWF
jgi:hypothetical protein